MKRSKKLILLNSFVAIAVTCSFTSPALADDGTRSCNSVYEQQVNFTVEGGGVAYVNSGKRDNTFIGVADQIAACTETALELTGAGNNGLVCCVFRGCKVVPATLWNAYSGPCNRNERLEIVSTECGADSKNTSDPVRSTVPIGG
ncbi:MAG: hypothetical protein KDD70_10335 [Bdellovibrionales bacterium]|nr:hypothetical protein [Bdellovibrionales bacterium]